MTIDYGKYHDSYIRENPDGPDAERLADMLANEEAELILAKLKTPNFTGRVLAHLMHAVS